MRTVLGATLASALVAGLVLTVCASTGTTRTSEADRLTTGLPAAATSTSAAPAPAPSATEGPFGPDGPDASDTPDPALSGEPLPTLPPGDPGTGSPGTGDSAETQPPVPAAAMLDTATVAAVAGGDWTVGSASQRWCDAPRTPGARTERVQVLESADGRLVQSVGSYAGTGADHAAVQAVDVTTERLQACGFTLDRDPRLGAASELLTRTAADGTDQVVLVLAAEGVGVVLMASGTPAGRGTWESLADLALGSSCAAATHGCH